MSVLFGPLRLTAPIGLIGSLAYGATLLSHSAAGWLVVGRVRKWPIVLAFLASYFALFAAATFVVGPPEVAEIFVGADLLAVVYFASFILTDPPTSPARAPAQVASGAVVAGASVAVFLWTGAAHFLLSGVLVGNLAEAIRRVWVSRIRRRRA